MSEAIYLGDPDGSGVELYGDRRKGLWPQKADGSLEMYTRPLGVADVLNEINTYIKQEIDHV